MSERKRGGETDLCKEGRDTEEKELVREAERSLSHLIHEEFLGCDDTSEGINRGEERRGEVEEAQQQKKTDSPFKSRLRGALSSGHIWEIPR